jgi:hypothetical protein
MQRRKLTQVVQPAHQCGPNLPARGERVTLDVPARFARLVFADADGRRAARRY